MWRSIPLADREESVLVKMCRILILFLVFAAIAVFVDGQLTFSSGWGNGKRSISVDPSNGDCSPEEAIYQIYQLIVVSTFPCFSYDLVLRDTYS